MLFVFLPSLYLLIISTSVFLEKALYKNWNWFDVLFKNIALLLV